MLSVELKQPYPANARVCRVTGRRSQQGAKTLRGVLHYREAIGGPRGSVGVTDVDIQYDIEPRLPGPRDGLVDEGGVGRAVFVVAQGNSYAVRAVSPESGEEPCVPISVGVSPRITSGSRAVLYVTGIVSDSNGSAIEFESLPAFRFDVVAAGV